MSAQAQTVDNSVPGYTDLISSDDEMYLRISNAGEIDVNALRLMGATTKRGDDSKIGFFGTGNKYALAWFLNNNIPVRIFSGLTEITIGTSDCQFGTETVSVITINGAQTSLTTSMGPTWEAWEAVREVYCNAIDEGEANTKTVSRCEPVAGVTQYYVGMSDAISEVVNNADAYFATKRDSVYESDTGRILPRKHGAIYRKGIRAIDTELKTCFDYDLLNVALNENRRLAYSWQAQQEVWKMIAKCDDSAIISKTLRASVLEGYFESDLGQYVDIPSVFCDAWRQFFNSRLVASPEMRNMMSTSEKDEATFINLRLIEATAKCFGDGAVTLPRSIRKKGTLMFSPIDMTDTNSSLLASCLLWLAEAGINIHYPIQAVSFEDKKVMGLADKSTDTIYLSEIVFTKGRHYLLSTLLEEYVHLKHGVSDETRDMQDALLDEFIHCLEAVKSKAAA